MGIVGFIRILEKAGKKHCIVFKENHIEFDIDILENFNDYYFEYFLLQYDIQQITRNKVNKSLNYLKSKQGKIDLASIKETLKKQADKVKDIDIEAYGRMTVLIKEIGSINHIDSFEKLSKLCDEFITILSSHEIRLKLSMNLFRSNVYEKYFGQVSFLQKKKASASLEEVKNIMYKDYLSSLIVLGKALDFIERNDKQGLKQFMEDTITKEYVHENIKRIFKKLIKKSFNNKYQTSIKDILQYESTCCSMCGEIKFLGSDYTEGCFVPLGVSSNNSKNMFWNCCIDYPLCDLCKLILFCTPAGATKVDKYNVVLAEKLHMRDGSKCIKRNEFYYDAFVNVDESINVLYINNEMFRVRKDTESPFTELIFDLIGENVIKSKWQLQNIFFIEFQSSVNAKSCKMNYFNIPKFLAEFFVNSGGKILESINKKAFKTAIIDYILKNIDTKELINKELRNRVKNQMLNGFDCYYATLTRYHLRKFKGGIKDMDDRKVKSIFMCGREIHDYYKAINSENKIDSIAYKLLNASKIGNQKEFMDILLRIFMTSGKSVPTVFLDVITENTLDFETIAYAFVSGLISEKFDKTDDNKEAIK